MVIAIMILGSRMFLFLDRKLLRKMNTYQCVLGFCMKELSCLGDLATAI